MSLNIANGSTSVIDVGSDSSLDDIAAGTAMIWVNIVARDPTHTFIRKRGSATQEIRFALVGNDGKMGFLIARATAALQAESSNFPVTFGWNFVVVTWDINGANGDQRMFRGDLTTPAVEVTYNVQTVGSGARGSDAGANMGLGNEAPGTAGFALGGDMAVVIICNEILTLNQIISVQFRPRVVVNSSGNNITIGYWQLNGTGTQPDLSGTGNNGTVTGATQADHVPLGPPFGFSLGFPALAAAAPADTSLIFQNKMRKRWPHLRM